MPAKVPEGRIMWCGFLESVSTTHLRHGSAGMVTWGSAERCPFIFLPKPIPVLGDLLLRCPAESPGRRAELGLRSSSAMPGLIHAAPNKLVARVRAFLSPTGLSPHVGVLD